MSWTGSILASKVDALYRVDCYVRVSIKQQNTLIGFIMVNCCRCNATGRCGNCACVKAKRKCNGCLPSRLGQCRNTETDRTNSSPNLSSNSSPLISSTRTIPPTVAPPSQSTSDSDSPTANRSNTSIVNRSSSSAGNSLRFTWGTIMTMDSSTFMQDLDKAYNTVVHWKRNLFRVPSGNVGKLFVLELTRLYDAFASKSSLESIALQATIVIPHLLLQKPHSRSKSKEHTSCLRRRLEQWKVGDIANLLDEGATIQARLLRPSLQKGSQKNRSKQFAELVFSGKIKQAMNMLSEDGKGGILRLDDEIPSSKGDQTVKEVLKSKHPPSQAADPNVCITGTPPQAHPITFEAIDANLIRFCALKATGACGPSGLEAYDWRRLCTSFQTASDSLCGALARVARRLCTTHISPEIIFPILACRLIALDKCRGVRPIGIGDMARRIMAKAVLQIVKGDLQEATGTKQLCTGQIAGVETAIHSVHDLFQHKDTEAVLLIDASNAFNSLNRKVALHNVQFTCPELSTIPQNTYGAPSDLFIDGETI